MKCELNVSKSHRSEHFYFVDWYTESLQSGDILVTNPGNLPSRNIIHYAQGASSDYIDVTCRCLMKAEEKRLTSIALPAFGTGVYSSSIAYFDQSYHF